MQNCRPLTFRELISNTRPKLRARYTRAYLNLKSGKVTSIDNAPAKVESFVKYEKMSEEAKEERKPARLIQHRSYEYLYLLKKYMLPIVKTIKQSDRLTIAGQKINTILGAGLNSKQMADRIHHLFERKTECVALCLDHSKWDGHFNEQLQNVAFDIWLGILHDSNYRRPLRWLLRNQRRNKCKSQSGLKYVVNNTRMSGEYTTSIENSIVNYMILQSVFPTAFIMVNGDDSIVFLSNAEYKQTPSDLRTVFREFGQDTKIDRVARRLTDISFCQCSPLLINGELRMVRDPIRCMSRSGYTALNLVSYDRYLCGLGLCELAANTGVPILQSFSLHLIQKGGATSPSTSVDRFPYALEEEIRIQPITSESRAEFENAFGISVAEQLAWEKQLQSSISADYLEKYKSFHRLNVLGDDDSPPLSSF